MADVSRTDVANLIQENYSTDLLTSAGATSQALNAFTRVNLGTKTTRMPVLATVPNAKWVGESATDPSGIKPTAKATWGSKQIVAEELAVIVPVHEHVLDDASVDVLSELTKMGGQAIGYALDAAVLFGINKPASWTSPDLAASAVEGDNLVQASDSAGVDDLGGALIQAAGLVADRYNPTTLLARAGLKYKLANLRNANGTPIFLPSLSNTPDTSDSVHGLSAHWIQGNVDNGAGGDTPIWDPTDYEALVVDRSRVIIGVRQDVEVKFLDQATVGGINLAERDMVALRFKARFGYVLGDTYADNSTSIGTASPVAAVLPAGSAVVDPGDEG